jgi:hypothetical protein
MIKTWRLNNLTRWKHPPASEIRLAVAVLVVGLIGFVAGVLAARSRTQASIHESASTPAPPPVNQMLAAVETADANHSAQPFAAPGPEGRSLRFSGSKISSESRVIIPRAAEQMGGALEDFTLEFWIRTTFGQNSSHPCSAFSGGWAEATPLFDASLSSPDEAGFGIGLANGRLAFGVQDGENGTTLCGDTFVDDGRWHNIAVTRSADTGHMLLFIDGIPDGSATGPVGAIHLDGPPYTPITIGAFAKPDLTLPGYSGYIDEVRLSKEVLYQDLFSRPEQPFEAGPTTLALFHLDESEGAALQDKFGSHDQVTNVDPESSGGGWCWYGGSPAGPEWWSDSPFNPALRPAPLAACSGGESVFLPNISR